MFGKIGEVATVNTAEKVARVKFDDQDDLMSAEMQWIETGEPWAPKVGQRVYCGYTEAKKGFILGTIAE